jgi:membrane protein DedA with SNARE-associated domain
VHEISDAVTGFIGDYGLYAVFSLMLVDAVLPAASELVMLYAGAVAAGAFAGHDVTLFGAQIDSTAWAYLAMAAAGTIGYTVGSILGWAIGLYGGRPYLERHGRWLHVTPEKLDRADVWFERYGDGTVLVTRVIPVVRSFVSIPAGIAEMPFVRYTVLSFLGTIPWCFGIAGAGLALGTGWERFHDAWRYADYVIVGVIVAAVAYAVLHVLRRRSRRQIRPSASE